MVHYFTTTVDVFFFWLQQQLTFTVNDFENFFSHHTHFLRQSIEKWHY